MPSVRSSRDRPHSAVDPLEFVEDEDPQPGVPDETDMYLFYGITWVVVRRSVPDRGRDFV